MVVEGVCDLRALRILNIFRFRFLFFSFSTGRKKSYLEEGRIIFVLILHLGEEIEWGRKAFRVGRKWDRGTISIKRPISALLDVAFPIPSPLQILPHKNPLTSLDSHADSEQVSKPQLFD